MFDQEDSELNVVMGVVFASFLVGLYLAHRGNLPQGAI